MQRVTTINLNGRAYQLDEDAYDALRAYLDDAERKLAGNPDRTEILADFEQAIAEKCDQRVGPHKTVVTAADMRRVIEEMGPVEIESAAAGPSAPGATGEAGQDAAPPAAAAVGPRPRKRLYRIPDGRMFGGVCTGLAAYTGVDVVVIRLLFILVAAVSFGAGILAYWILVFIVPEALTSEALAAAHGQRFSAQDLIDQAKKTAADLTGQAARTGATWKRQWRAQRRQWRAERRARYRFWRAYAGDGPAWPPWPAPRPYPPAALSWLVIPLFAVLGIALTVLLVAAVMSLFNTGAIFGWSLPAGLPLWAGVLILFVLFQIVAGPLRVARYGTYDAWGRPHPALAMWDGLFGTALVVLAIWILYRHMPPTHDFREFMQNLPDAVRAVAGEIARWFRGVTTS
jgi:phage shock protein PspC (stress-responsive transcriptional regulator)